MIKNKVLAFVVFILTFFVSWNLLDYLFAAVISHGDYTFTLFGDAILPTVVAVVIAVLTINKKE